MNKFPIIEILAFFCRYQKLDKPAWRQKYVRQLERVRSCHSKTDGGVKKSFYSVECKSGEIVDLVFNEEELLWSMQRPSTHYPEHVVDRVLALIKRHKHTPSRAHRIIPYRFEIIPKNLIATSNPGTESALIDRMQPYRFQPGKIPSTQVIKVVTKHMENVMITKHLHYIVEADSQLFFTWFIFWMNVIGDLCKRWIRSFFSLNKSSFISDL